MDFGTGNPRVSQMRVRREAITTALVGSRSKAADTSHAPTLHATERKDGWATPAPIETLAPSEQTPSTSSSNLDRECSGNIC